MVVPCQLLLARVMHQRLFPKKNRFSYGVYYLMMPLPMDPLPPFLLGWRSRWVMGFDARDLGYRNGSDPSGWASHVLHDHHIAGVTRMLLLTMPKVLGYVFNPVSFYFCYDEMDGLRAVIAEVHNTFGEQHAYLCVHPDQRPIEALDWITADKVFHVSPFLERQGVYRFRFDMRPSQVAIHIHYHHDNGKPQLITSLIGTVTPCTRATLRRAFWAHPLVTLKTIGLIHWQAIRLILKGVGVIKKPVQHPVTVTISHPLDADLSSTPQGDPL